MILATKSNYQIYFEDKERNAMKVTAEILNDLYSTLDTEGYSELHDSKNGLGVYADDLWRARVTLENLIQFTGEGEIK